MSDAFIRALARIVVAQICDDTKFTAIQRSASDTLSDVLIRYITQLGAAAHANAEHAGRTDSNLDDILLAFSELGASVRDIKDYVNATEETPFARPIPSFPIRRAPKVKPPSFAQIGETPPRTDIPDWLPAFPDKHTYVATPDWPTRKVDPKKDLVDQGKERRKAEQSLVALHQRLGLLTGRGGGGNPSPQSPADRFGVLGSGSDAAEPSETRIQAPSLFPPPLPAGTVSVTPLIELGYSEDFKPLPEGVVNGNISIEGGGRAGAAGMPSFLDAFAPILEPANREKEGEEGEAMEDIKREGGGMLPVNPELSERGGWHEDMPCPKGTPTLAFDWGTKLRLRALDAQRQLWGLGGAKMEGRGGLGGGGRAKKATEKVRERRDKEDEREEKRRRAEIILAQAEQEERDELEGVVQAVEVL